MNAQVERSNGVLGAWLTTARILWVVLAVGYLVLWLASLPGFYERVSTLTVEPFRLGERIVFDNDMARQEAIERGMSVQADAIYDIAFDFIQMLVYYLVAAVILWRASSGFGWFTALVLMLLPVTVMERTVGVAPPLPGALFLIEIPGYLAWPFWMLWLYLFPNGKPVSRRSLLAIAALLSLFLALQIASLLAVGGFLPPQIDTFAATFGPLLGLPLIGVILSTQIHRYMRFSTAVERQQTKWFLFGVAVLFLVLVAFAIVRNYFNSTYVRDLVSAALLVFPLAVGVAVLRYRLFDIDLIIRRTLIYGLLTATLALFYLGCVIVLQQVLRGITGQGSDIAIIVSTLAIAALFNPLRRRVQDLIDRRFYRRKYDTAKVMAAFSATVRDEVGLEKLTDHLLAVVSETMQPRSVSLWLRTLAPSSSPNPAGERGWGIRGEVRNAVRNDFETIE